MLLTYRKISTFVSAWEYPELCVLKKYAIPLLKEISVDDEYYITANRLLKYLKYFTEIEEYAIPCNSLLREFIGGSCFYDV